MTHTTPLRRLLATVAIAAAIPLATACGADTTPPATGTTSTGTTSAGTTASATAVAAGDAAYCDALRSGQKELESMTAKITDQAALQQGLAVLAKIEATAPTEVKSAWGDFIDFVKTAASGNTSAMAGALAKMEAAGTTIQAHAKSACNINMS